MSQIPFNFPLTGGLDRTIVPSKANAASFYTMHNWRQPRIGFGAPETTPRFVLTGTASQGTYWDGAASATEPTTSAVRWKQVSPLGNNLVMTDYCLRDTVVGQVKCISQITAPATSGITKGCLLLVNSISTWTVALGSTYDVEIDGATTFKWRVNGGAYTALVAINATAGNAIDGGAVQLYWLASTGFTPGDAWSWRRTDRISESVSGLTRTPWVLNSTGITSAGNTIFFVDPNGGGTNTCPIKAIVKDSSSEPYVRTVGYQPVYGRSITIYESHLFIIGPGDMWQSSDLDDFDDFIPTDVNEADYGSLRLVTDRATTSEYTLFGYVFGSRFFLFTTKGLWYSDYAGLPIPFSFKRLYDIEIEFAASPIAVATIEGLYVARTDSLWFFDGQTFAPVTFNKFSTLLGVSSVSPYKVVYDPINFEVHILFNTIGILLTYQERTKTFHTRSVDFSSSGATSLNISATGVMLSGTSSRKYYTEDTAYSGTPVNDSTDGSALAAAVLCTQLIGEVASKVKELSPVYVAPTASTVGNNYSNSANIQLQLGWIKSTDGKITGSATTHASSVWTSASTDGLISFPRVDYRFIALQLTSIGLDASKPPAALSLQHLETSVRQPEPVRR